MPRPRTAIKTKKRARDGLFSISYAEDPGRWHATGQDNRLDAIAWAKRKRAEFLDSRPILFRDAARGFFDEGSPWVARQVRRGRRFSAAYLPQMRGRLAGYLLPAWGDKPVGEITRRLFEDWLLDLRGIKGRTIKNSTKNKILDCALILFREWQDSGVCRVNPMDGLTHLIESDETPRSIFSQDELSAMFPADRTEAERVWADQGKQHREHGQLWLSYFTALRDTGARPSELLALTWGDWRAEDCGFAIRRAVENTTGRIKETTKTGSKKPVFLSARGVQELMLWCAASDHTRPGDLIWSFDGRLPVRTESAAKHFRGVCKRAGVTRGNRTPYCLRHTFTTRALETLPLHDVQVLLGHSRASMTALSSYFHPTDAMIMRMGAGAREALKDLWC